MHPNVKRVFSDNNMSETKQKGLSTAEVEKSRAEHGVNVISPVKSDSVWKLFIEKFNDPIIKILIAAALISLGVAFVEGEGHFGETIGIISAILLATGVSFWFEYDAKRRFDVLNTVNDDVPVKVVRDGHVREIPRRDIVVDDIVILESGEEVPADGVLSDAISLKINESALTGELQVNKTIDPKHFDIEATYPSNHIMRGTLVAEGYGRMTVTAVGDSTEFGKVAEQSKTKSGVKTPLTLQLEKLSNIVGKVGVTLAVLVFAALAAKDFFFTGALAGADWMTIASRLLNYFMVSVAIMVMALPEGLPMSITLSLAMNMRRMLKTNNLVRKMHASETMGAVTVICTDKTGTLTRNEMNVYEMLRYGELDDSVFYEMIAMNSTAFLDENGRAIGNPTEGALLLWLSAQAVDYTQYREPKTIVDQLTFSTENKYMATLVDSPIAGRRMLYIKGAPEVVRAMCAETGGETVDRRLQEFQGKAMRTLAFAWAEATAATVDEALKEGQVQFAGYCGIEDPVRDDVPQAVMSCMEAGIAIKMITGDTSATAIEIARRIGLWTAEDTQERNHLTGVEFDELSDEVLLERVRDLKVMSRARPLDKQRLVRLLQQLDEVVAVTGDGTNDAPALNFAQVGLSMGTGTSVAKEASDITLLDDSFASIATAVMWGRSLYKNIQRFVLFQLTVNFVALAVVFFGSIFGSQLPLTVTQMLWVNLIMDTFAAMALASLPPSQSVMKEKPRKSTDFIITPGIARWILWIGLAMIAALLGLLLYWGADITLYQLTLFFTVFVMLHFWNLFNAKAYGARGSVFADMRRCPAFVAVLFIILAGQWAIVQFGGQVFRVEPMMLKDWGIVIAATSAVMFMGEIIRGVGRK